MYQREPQEEIGGQAKPGAVFGSAHIPEWRALLDKNPFRVQASFVSWVRDLAADSQPLIDALARCVGFVDPTILNGRKSQESAGLVLWEYAGHLAGPDFSSWMAKLALCVDTLAGRTECREAMGTESWVDLFYLIRQSDLDSTHQGLREALMSLLRAFDAGQNLSDREARRDFTDLLISRQAGLNLTSRWLGLIKNPQGDKSLYASAFDALKGLLVSTASLDLGTLQEACHGVLFRLKNASLKDSTKRQELHQRLIKIVSEGPDCYRETLIALIKAPDTQHD